MSINEFVEMTIFLCLICFSIYDNIQGFVDESGLFIFFIYLLIFFFFFFFFLPKVVGKRFFFFFFCKILSVDSADTLWVKNFVEIALSRSISEINSFLRFMQKFKMVTKSGKKMNFEESCQNTLPIPCGSKISSKSLYLAPFPR